MCDGLICMPQGAPWEGLSGSVVRGVLYSAQSVQYGAKVAPG